MARIALLLACAGLLAGCASDAFVPTDLGRSGTVAEESSPLGGPALDHYRERMKRMHHDLIHMQATLDRLRYRGNRGSTLQLGRFIDAYMGMHVEPVLRPEWQSRHPELMELDANLRFVQADILARMSQTGRAEERMDDIEERYAGRGEMLVDYPIGSRSRLSDALQMLRDGKWRRPRG
jgi:hypothetical protein